MKDCAFVLEFTRHVLANENGPDGVRDKFQRDSQGKLIFQQAWFYSAFAQAISLTRVRGIKPGDFHMDLTVDAPTEMYKRKYGEDKFRTHEAIMPGTQVKFNAIVADHVTQSTLELLLDRMGKFVGLSPYGYKLGYGRFITKLVEVAPSDAENNTGNSAAKPQMQQAQE